MSLAVGVLERILGDFGPPNGAATLVVVSGLHGNEPAGVLASQRVAASLETRGAALKGRVVLLAGNLAALGAGVRYVDRDMNRAWTPGQIRALRNGGAGGGAGGGGHGTGSVEDAEQRALLEVLDGLVRDAPGPVYLLDLHTTSGAGSAFSTVADTLRNRALALTLPVPVVLGLEEMVEGTLHDYMGQLGVVTLAFEAGQHQEPAAVDRAEAALWIILAATGVADTRGVPEAAGARALLAEGHRALPRAVEMRYRHPIAPGDRFRMRPGYLNFQPVRKGEPVARDLDGDVLAPESARILMPLYQEKGSDGFFLVREFKPLWLRVSGAVRRARLDRVVHWLPGIRRHPTEPHSLVVDRRVARWYALQVLHLLGFRREVEVGTTLVVQRRAHDV
ncbi:MAG TPA: succinylglutamate desuccinylase/aspartoacylase family protein [Longimicrobiales bacterium]|nr:succinylglutamate desuccinylase/aspartoacylase family protein [Longimicrobiales bacterium]